MSKRNLALVMVVGAVMASSAYADRARILVEGTGDAGAILGPNGSNGTFYTDDAYNMFYNPAYVNDYKNWATIEKSNFSGQNNNAVTATTASSYTATNGTTAQGGFVTSVGNFALGIYLNRQDALWDAIYLGGGSATQSSMRPLDVIFGGDAGFMKWGVSATYSAYSTPNVANAQPNTSKVSNDVVVRAGAEWMDLEPFVNWRAIGTDYGSSLSPKNSAIGGGLRYHWGDWTPFAAIRHDSYNGNTDYNAYGIGLGRTMKLTDAVKMGYSVAWFRQSTPCNGNCSGAVATSAGAFASSANPNLNNGTTTYGDRTVVPLNISVEADAATWVTVRAGLGYNFMDQVAGQTVADNTSGRLGSTFHMGKADLDMAVGKTVSSASEGLTDTNSQNFDVANGFFTAAALSYHW